MGELRSSARFEELQWLSCEIESRLLEPLIDDASREPIRIVLAATGQHGGLLLDFQSKGPLSDRLVPFSVSAMEERGLPTVAMHEIFAEVLSA